MDFLKRFDSMKDKTFRTEIEEGRVCKAFLEGCSIAMEQKPSCENTDEI